MVAGATLDSYSLPVGLVQSLVYVRQDYEVRDASPELRTPTWSRPPQVTVIPASHSSSKQMSLRLTGSVLIPKTRIGSAESMLLASLSVFSRKELMDLSNHA